MSVLYQIYHASGNDHGRTEYIRLVNSPKEAVLILDVLARYDLALGDSIVWNAQGLQVSYNNGETWEEWEDEYGDGIGEYDYERARTL